MKEYFFSKGFIRIKPDVEYEKVSVAKIYLHVTIKYLYDDKIKPPSLGGLVEAIDSDEHSIFSDSKLS